MKKVRHKQSIFFVITDVIQSDQVFEYVRVALERTPHLRIFLQGSENQPLGRRILELKKNSDFKLRVFEKFSLKLYVEFFLRLAYSKQTTGVGAVILSGGKQTTYCLLISFILRIKQRIFVRHYAAMHFEMGSRKGILLDQISSSLASIIIAISHTVREQLIKEQVPIRKIRTIVYGVELSRFTPKPTISSQSQNDIQFSVGVISRVASGKGISDILDSWELLDQEIRSRSKLMILGAASDDKESVARLESGSVYGVVWVKEHVDAVNFLSNLSLFVHVPASRYAEGFGLVFVESIASGLNCIFTRSGIVAQESLSLSGVSFVPFRSPTHIKSEIERAFKQRFERGVSEDASRTQFLAKFSMNRMKSDFAALLEELNA